MLQMGTRPRSITVDNPNERNSPDNKRINMHQEHEVKYWTNVLNVTRNELAAAVEKVGVMADKVREYFATQRGKRTG